MLSDEEKKALEILKSFEPDDLVECAIYLQAIEKITNLIKKQSKEIEEQAKRRWVHIKENGEIEPLYYISKDKIKAKIEELKNLDLTTVYLNGVYDGEKKVQDKIKAKIEEVSNGAYDAKIVLQSLLEKE